MSLRDTPTWSVDIRPSAEKEWDSLPVTVQQEVTALLDDMRDDPFALFPDALHGIRNTFKFSIGRGAYRMIITINTRRREVGVLRIAPRGTVYSGLPTGPKADR